MALNGPWKLFNLKAILWGYGAFLGTVILPFSPFLAIVAIYNFVDLTLINPIILFSLGALAFLAGLWPMLRLSFWLTYTVLTGEINLRYPFNLTKGKVWPIFIIFFLSIALMGFSFWIYETTIYTLLGSSLEDYLKKSFSSDVIPLSFPLIFVFFSSIFTSKTLEFLCTNTFTSLYLRCAKENETTTPNLVLPTVIPEQL